MTDRSARDGFTLVETLVVVTLIAVVATAISALFTVIVRTVPLTEDRPDDARSLLSLATRLSTDVGETPQMPVGSATDHWDVDTKKASGCEGDDPGINLVRLAWDEPVGGGPATVIAAYRLLDGDAATHVVRLTCAPGEPPSHHRVTADLPPLDDLAISASLIEEPRDGVAHVVGVRLTIADDDDEEEEEPNALPDPIEIVARSHNQNQTLPAVPPAVTSTTVTTTVTTEAVTTEAVMRTAAPEPPPAASMPTETTAGEQAPVELTIRRDEPIVAELPAGPHGDDDDVSVTLDSLPTGWSASVVGLTVTMTAVDPGANTYTIPYTVTGSAGVTTSSTIIVTLTPIPCSARFTSVTPDAVPRVGNGASTFPLASDVAVRIDASGDCETLALRYVPDPATGTVHLLTFGGSIEVTIPRRAGVRWSSGAHVLELVQFAGSPDEVRQADTRSLTVLRDR